MRLEPRKTQVKENAESSPNLRSRSAEMGQLVTEGENGGTLKQASAGRASADGSQLLLGAGDLGLGPLEADMQGAALG